MKTSIDLLSAKFSIHGHIKFTSNREIIVVEITHPYAKASVSLYGAHVISFQPKGQQDVLWMSDQSLFEEGKPIRGGIPVCFPWFGPHETDAQKPVHGFARLKRWEVFGTSVLQSGEVQLQLQLKDSPETKLLWPHSFELLITITLGKTLEISLRCTNKGNETFTYSDALHSYFAVSDVQKIKLLGFKGFSYYDGLEKGVVRKQNEEFLIIQKEESRRYFDFTDDCIIIDSPSSRKIRVEKKGSRVTLVWNPWANTAKNIPDMPDDGYKNMICVEAVNSNNDIVSIPSNGSFTLSTRVSII